MNIKELEDEINSAREMLLELNPNISGRRKTDHHGYLKKRKHRLQKVLVANRGEIAKRFLLALHEENIPSVAVVTDVDVGQSWYEFADEVVSIGGKDNYAATPVIIAAARLVNANAIYSGYGFLSESADFVDAIESVSADNEERIIFMGPGAATIRLMGDKLRARTLARENDIPLFESSDLFTSTDLPAIKNEARRIGYPVIVKLTAGGGGKGMYVVRKNSELKNAVTSSFRIGEELYGNGSFFLEKYIEKPVHMEVQIFNNRVIGFRKCAVQRRNQKIIEESGHAFIDENISAEFLDAAEKISSLSGYGDGGGAGTVEFLIDDESGRFGFLEMNTRLQVEYAVTDQSLGIDLARWQILHFDGRDDELEEILLLNKNSQRKDHSIECRIYAEDPDNDYLPSPGVISEINLPSFNGIRCDFGFRNGDRILSMYDPMIGKLIVHGPTRDEALVRLDRALQEIYIRGVKTNIDQLIKIVRHPDFKSGKYNNNLLQKHSHFTEESTGRAADNTDRRSRKHIIFSAFAEYVRLLNKAIGDFMVIAGFEGLVDIPAAAGVPHKFKLVYNNNHYRAEFIRTSINTFFVYINDVYNGEICLRSFGDRNEDLLILFGNRSYRIRIDRYQETLILKMKDDNNRINYYRVGVLPEGFVETEKEGIIRSPFQGTFVSFCNNELAPGAEVNEGDPLLILSSMKMETIIYSPVKGTVDSIIEDGDLQRLYVSRTSDGRVIGRSINEGEVLLKIAVNDPSVDSGSEPEPDPDEALYQHREFHDTLMFSNYNRVVKNISPEYFEEVLFMLRSAAMGFIQQPNVIDKLKMAFGVIAGDESFDSHKEGVFAFINDIILHYVNITKLFSTVILKDGLTYLEEMNFLIMNMHRDMKLSPLFEKLYSEIENAYGIDDGTHRPEMKDAVRQHMYYLIKQSYQFFIDHSKIISSLVSLYVRVSTFKKETGGTLIKLLEQEQASLDDSLSKYIKKIISEHYGDEINGTASVADAAVIDDRDSVNAMLAERDNQVYEKISASLQKPEPELIPGAMGEELYGAMLLRLKILQQDSVLDRLYSAFDNMYVYRRKKKHAGRDGLTVICCVTLAENRDLALTFKDNMRRSASILSGYCSADAALADNWIELIIHGGEIAWGDGEGMCSFEALRQYIDAIVPFFMDGTVAKGIVEFSARSRWAEKSELKKILFYYKNNAVVMDLLHPYNPMNPYRQTGDAPQVEMHLAENNKWTIDQWAEACFDPETVIEIIIDSIDENPHGTGGRRPVGSKIMTGAIDGVKACFYMKDSRISGGATGDREGLKYVAAAYLAYMKKWPLYIWNDSAGANIREGIVSLNRGAAGFMMNALMAERADYDTVRQYTENVSDENLRMLFRELDRAFGLTRDEFFKADSIFQFIVIGIGSSAGLDVYGSSQAGIQILLDSEQSYRVLTGSSVVKTVIGEDISNYDIGGAKILGKWTGIVDIIAKDKVDLVDQVHHVHDLFCSPRKKNNGPGRKKQNSPGFQTADTHEAIVFSESIVESNVDNDDFFLFKNEYHASKSLIGGFARLGGKRVLIMGCRYHSGLRSTHSITKARELLRIAHSTASSQVLIFGKKWEYTPDYHENIRMQSRLDLLNTAGKKSGIRIHIITHIEGLKSYDINHSADVIILAADHDGHHDGHGFAEKNATFIVKSFAEAFELSAKLINYMEPGEARQFKEPACKVSVPDDPAEPYDMVESVIKCVFDEDSFIEFFQDMNDPLSGPTLITGLALLEGEPVGIIADQPLQKGGGADALGTEKFRVFTELLNANNIPLVMLSNSSGFVPGSQQERFRIQAIGADSINANVLGTIPVVSVVLNQNYGGRLIHAFNKFLRPGIVFLALEKAVMAVIGEEAAFDLLASRKYNALVSEGKAEEAGLFRQDFFAGYLEKARAEQDGITTGLVDWIIPDALKLREEILKGMVLAKERCSEAFTAPGIRCVPPDSMKKP